MTESEVTAVRKRDGRGRVLSTARQRQAVLEQFERSGLSGPAFARVAGLKYQTFATWRQQHKKAKLEVAAVPSCTPRVGQAVNLVEVAWPRAGMADTAKLRLELPGGACLVLTEASQVPLAARLLQALAEPC